MSRPVRLRLYASIRARKDFYHQIHFSFDDIDKRFPAKAACAGGLF